MKKFITAILTGLFLFLPFFPSSAQEKVNIYFFYGDGCPHCNKEEKFLDYLEKTRNDIRIYRYETWRNTSNAQLLGKIAKELNLNIAGVPVTIIGDQTINGYYNDQVTGEKIKAIIDDYSVNGCSDIVAPLLHEDPIQDQCTHGCASGDEECLQRCGCSAIVSTSGQAALEKINIPFLGEINIKDYSLPVLTFIIAATDGFNPCAMWVLVFLISLLLGMKDKWRMWILGSAFIFASALVYFLFLSAWLNVFLFIGFVMWIRITIGLVALASGGYHLYDFYSNKEGACKVTGNEKRKLIMEKLRQVADSHNFWLALGGILILAVAVNMVELVCSAGLPAVYTQILAMASLPKWSYYLYLIFYVFIFMLDDLLVFVLAMKTLELKAGSARYSRWANLLGGIIMVIIGILLIFKPGLLMFG